MCAGSSWCSRAGGGGSVLSMGRCPVCVEALMALPYASPGSPRNAKTVGQGGGKV